MPRESVYDSASLFSIEIGWDKERSNVQVGLAVNSDKSIAQYLAGVQDAEMHDVEINDGSVVTDIVKLPGFNSLWATLDREQINRMIRLLRKARDDAYGRDE